MVIEWIVQDARADELVIEVPKALIDAGEPIQVGVYAWCLRYLHLNAGRPVDADELAFMAQKQGLGDITERLPAISKALEDLLNAWRLQEVEEEDRWEDAERQWAEHIASPAYQEAVSKRNERQNAAEELPSTLPPIEGHLTKGNHGVYRHFDEYGRLLYVGVTNNIQSRTKDHRWSTWYKRIAMVTVEEHDSRGEALRAELNAILDEKPECNRSAHAHKGDRLFQKELAE